MTNPLKEKIAEQAIEIEQLIKELGSVTATLTYIIYQSGGLIEIKDKTREEVAGYDFVDFHGEHDDLRKVQVISLKLSKDNSNGK